MLLERELGLALHEIMYCRNYGNANSGNDLMDDESEMLHGICARFVERSVSNAPNSSLVPLIGAAGYVLKVDYSVPLTLLH